jgi:hypothetical protein
MWSKTASGVSQNNDCSVPSSSTQRQKRWSSARLGANTAAMASVPQSWSNWASSASATSGGTPIG